MPKRTSTASVLVVLTGLGLAWSEEQLIAPRQDAPTATVAAVPAAPLSKVLEQLKTTAQPAARLAALRDLAQLRPQPVPGEVRGELLRAILLDGDAEVQKEAVLVLKALDDQEGKRNLLAVALHPKVSAEIRARGAEAIRTLDDPILIETIVRLVTMEVRAAFSAEGPASRETAITSPNTPLRLPIKLPSVEIDKFEGVVVVPALGALKIIARRDLGDDPQAWKQWFENWKQIREVRIKPQGAP